MPFQRFSASPHFRAHAPALRSHVAPPSMSGTGNFPSSNSQDVPDPGQDSYFAAALSAFTAAAASGSRNTAVPATNTFAPALAHRAMVAGATPPSTST